MSRLNCIALRCSYKFSSHSSFRIRTRASSDINYLTIATNARGYSTGPSVRRNRSCLLTGLRQSTFSRLLKSTWYASEFQLFRGATQKRTARGGTEHGGSMYLAR